MDEMNMEHIHVIYCWTYVLNEKTIIIFRNNGGSQYHKCPNKANQLQCVWEQAEDNIIINSGHHWIYAVVVRNMKLDKIKTITPFMISDITTIGIHITSK